MQQIKFSEKENKIIKKAYAILQDNKKQEKKLVSFINQADLQILKFQPLYEFCYMTACQVIYNDQRSQIDNKLLKDDNQLIWLRGMKQPFDKADLEKRILQFSEDENPLTLDGKIEPVCI